MCKDLLSPDSLAKAQSYAQQELPVLNDMGATARNDVESRLLKRYPSEIDRSRLVPVFTDREAFLRAAGLNGVDHEGGRHP